MLAGEKTVAGGAYTAEAEWVSVKPILLPANLSMWGDFALQGIAGEIAVNDVITKYDDNAGLLLFHILPPGTCCPVKRERG